MHPADPDAEQEFEQQCTRALDHGKVQSWQHLRLACPQEWSNLVDTMDAYARRMRSPDDIDVSLVRCDGKDECTACGKSKSLHCARVVPGLAKEKGT